MQSQSRLNWLITGAGGMLGTDLHQALLAAGEDVLALRRSDLDVNDLESLKSFVRAAPPSIIVNCAAYTKVDLAESEETAAAQVNGAAVENLAGVSNALEALLVQISTDFVFDGTATEPYETDAPTAPLSAYGRTKLLGERAAAKADRHLIIRTSWLFGTRGPNFVEAIRNQIRKGTNPLRVVADQKGKPTYTPHLADAIIRLAKAAHASAEARGVVHYADAGACSWFDFARAIVEEEGSDVDVVPVTTAEFPRPARRPAYSVLSTARYEALTGCRPASWREGLREYLRSRPAGN